MEASTLTVLRTVYELQFVGWPTTNNSPARWVRFDPVPVAAVFGELAGTDIDVHRELRLLEIAGCVCPDPTDWTHDVEQYRYVWFTRGDGKMVHLDAELGCVRIAWDGVHLEQLALTGASADLCRRRYTMTQPGLDLLRAPASGRDDHSTSGGGKKGRVLGLLHEHYIAPLIVLIVGAAVLICIGLVP